MTGQRPPPIPRAFSKKRREFEKARHTALSAKRKGTRWRKLQAWLYCQQDGAFIDTFFIGHRHEEKTLVRVSIKPLNLDPLFWRIVGMPENEHGRSSLRANGVFACRALPVLEETISDEMLDPASSAARLLAFADAGAEMALQK